jgi:Protein of unknown function (DUF4239)
MTLFNKVLLIAQYQQAVRILMILAASTTSFAFTASVVPFRIHRISSQPPPVVQHNNHHKWFKRDGATTTFASSKRHHATPRPLSAGGDQQADYDVKPKNSNKKTHTMPPFPRSSYHLSRNEEQNRHLFISFIDHFDESYTQVARLIEPRRYARSDQFENNNNNNNNNSSQQLPPPSIDDVACPPSMYSPIANFLAWNRLPARIIVGTLAYACFPIIVNILESYTTVDYQFSGLAAGKPADLTFLERLNILAAIWENSDVIGVSADGGGGGDDSLSRVLVTTNKENSERLANLVNLYLPGVAIVLGTYFSMTLGILYDRFSELQRTVALEASTMAYCFQLLLDLFEQDEARLIVSTQCIADQVNVLVRDSRGKETMRIIYNDPYTNILRIVQSYKRDAAAQQLQQQQQDSRNLSPFQQQQQQRQSSSNLPLVGNVRDVVRQLFELRTKRMNCEANALAPAHFDLMTFLAGLLLVGTTLGTVATAQTNGIPTEASRILFSALVVCYTTIYEMAYDLNRPFDGIYQIKRSGAATYFLQIKHLVVHHPVLRDHISFHPHVDESVDDTTIPKTNKLEQREIWYN